MAMHNGLGATLQTRTRRQKRSQVASLILMGAAPFVVLGVDPLHTDVRVFSGLQDCQQALPTATAYCTQLDAEAALRHVSMAPRYATWEQCEADFAHVSAPHDCQKGWCDATRLSVCEQSAEGQFRPAYNGFLVEQSVVERARRGYRPEPASLAERELQPVYGMSQDALLADEGGGYSYYGYIPFHSHFVTANAQYLARRGDRDPLNLKKSQLSAGAGKLQSGPIQRGGFGATARQTMQTASS